MKNIYRFVFLALILNVILISNDLKAQTNFWEKSNDLPNDQYVKFTMDADGNIYSINADYSSIYLSTNNGDTWSSTNFVTNRSSYVREIAVGKAGYMYVGTDDGLCRSSNKGKTWERISSGIENNPVYSIIINATGDVFISQSVVHKSTNNGIDWEIVTLNTGKLALNVHGDIFLCTAANGLYRSIDNGITWDLINSGFPQPLLAVQAITFTPSEEIYIALERKGVYKSTDNGDHWIQTTLNITTSYYLASNSKNDVYAATVGANLYSTTDGGITWKKSNLSEDYQSSIFIDKKDQIYVSTAEKVFRSADNGVSWSRLQNTLNLLYVTVLANDVFGNVYAGADNGIYKSADDGKSWESVNNNLPNLVLRCIGTNSKGVVFIGTNSGVFRLTSSGWEKIFLGIPDSIINTIVISSNDYIYVGSKHGVFRSTNDGDTWIPTGSFNLNYKELLFLTKLSSNTILAATFSNIYSTTNEGDNWKEIFPNIFSCGVNALYSDMYGDILIGTSIGQILYSQDNNNSWGRYDFQDRDICINSIISDGNRYFYIGTHDDGIYRSTDNCTSWIQLNEGLSDKNVFAFTLNTHGYLFSGTNNGVYRSIRTLTSINNRGITLPSSFSLDHIYPNPFGGATLAGVENTLIHFSLPSSGNVTLKIYDVLGKEIETLVNEVRDAGKYSVNWNAQNKPSGMYLCRLTMNNMSMTKTIMLVK